MRIKVLIITLLIFMAAPLVHAQKVENIRIFGTKPQGGSDDASILSCFAGWREFLSAGAGQLDYRERWQYFVDIFYRSVFPLYFADITNVEQQLNKARYAVMGAFLRCEKDRLSSVSEAYYRLEAELYFLRNFVDTSGDFVLIKTENPAQRKKLLDEMIGYFKIRKPSADPNVDSLRFTGYFDLFESKYRYRARTYRGFGDDPVFTQLVEKFDQLVATMKSFQEFGHEVSELADEAIVQPASSLNDALNSYDVDKQAWDKPGSSILSGLKAIASKFDACAEFNNERHCLSGLADLSQEEIEAIQNGTEDAFSDGGQRTFDQVMVQIQNQNQASSRDVTLAELQTRYELLYGQIDGSGATAVIERMDKLIGILGEPERGFFEVDPSNPDGTGSIEVIHTIYKCAKAIDDKQCKA